MKNDAINDVLHELRFSDNQKKGFLRFLRYAKTCQETGNNKQLKPQLLEIVKEISQREKTNEN